MKRFKILLVGDYCLDIYYYGVVNKISPEAPVPILSFQRKEEKDGMAGNVLKNLEQFPCDVVFQTSGRSIKTRFIDSYSGQHLLRLDDDPYREPIEIKNFFSKNNFDAVAISDYEKGSISYETVKYIQDNFQGPIFIDTKKKKLAEFEGAFVKINQKEFRESITLPENNLIVTLSEKGAKFNEKIFDSYKIPLIDVCGAGDTFFASLIYQYLNISDIEEAIKFANKAAAVTVQKIGVYAPSLEEIESLE